MQNSISIKELAELCVKYDKSNGSFPESRYEGMSVFQYILAKLGFIESEFDDKETVEFIDSLNKVHAKTLEKLDISYYVE